MKPNPLAFGPRCPRCDQPLAQSLARTERESRPTLACPEPYCGYAWTPTRGELARLGPLPAAEDLADELSAS